MSHRAFSAPQILDLETQGWRQRGVNHWVARSIRQLCPNPKGQTAAREFDLVQIWR